MSNPWFRIVNAGDKQARSDIYDDIGQQVQFIVACDQRGHQVDHVADRTNPNAPIKRAPAYISPDL